MELKIVAMVQKQVPATLSDGTEGVVIETTLYIPPMYYGGTATRIKTTDCCIDFERHVKVFDSQDEAFAYAESFLYG